MIYEAGFFWRAGLTKWWGLSGAEWLHTSANVQVAIYFFLPLGLCATFVFVEENITKN